MTSILELDSVNAAYGPFRALFGVSFTIEEGTTTALLGANGSGKTTVARLCSGLIDPTAGTIWFRGTDIGSKKAYEVARLRIAQAPEGRSVFATLTVDENLRLSFRQSVGAKGVPDALERAYEAFPQLAERAGQEAGTLSGGEQRMLSLARVLADPPDLLIADELSLGLAPIIVDEVYETLRRINAAGTSLLVVEQQIGHALALAENAVVLAQGRVAYVGPVDGARDLTAELALGGTESGDTGTGDPP